MVSRIQESRSAVINIAVVAACVGLDRWIRRNWDLKGWSRIPRIVPLTVIDALGAFNGLQLLIKGVQLAAGGRDSWEAMANSAILRHEHADDDQLEGCPLASQDPSWPPKAEFEFAVFDRKIGNKEFSVGEHTPDGLLCGASGAIEIRKSACDVTFSLTNDGADQTAAHKAFAGYLFEARKNENLFRAAREMIGSAVNCVWVYTRKLAVWSRGIWLYVMPYIVNYQGAILRPLTADQRLGEYTHALHASQMGRMAVFVMEKQGQEWVTLRKMVQVNDDFDTTSATYLLKSGDVVCMVSGNAAEWVRHKVDKGDAFAPALCDPTLLPDGDNTITAESVRNALKGVSQDPAIVFSVPGI